MNTRRARSSSPAGSARSRRASCRSRMWTAGTAAACSTACSILMIHRRDGFRAHHATVAQVQGLCAAGKMELRTFWEVTAIHGGDWVEGVTIHNSKTKVEEQVAVEAVIPQLGFLSSLGAIAEWGLELDK